MKRAPAADPAAHARQAFLRACALDVQVRKPGNVSLASPGHRMDAGQFIAAATAAAEPISWSGASVGQRIESAMRAAWEGTRCNTNLGIVLLCAPLLAASERPGSTADVQALRAALEAVLQSLDVADTRAAYRAIALARPAGLGRAPEQDVFEAPTVGLREAMALAAGRDRIAWQYVHAYADVFDFGLPAFRAAPAAAPAMQRVFLEFLAGLPDSHIVRKHGDAVAQSVMREAAPWCARARLGGVLDDDPAFRRWDEGLKERGLNPGTSADLCVAVALAATLLDPPSRFP